MAQIKCDDGIEKIKGGNSLFWHPSWERFKDLLRQCPHHGFSELHQLDTFYNALNPNDQHALDSAAGANFLDKIPRECLSIIKSKSKVRYSRSRVTDLRVSTNAPLPSSSPSHSFDLQQIAASLEDKLDICMNPFEKSLNDIKASFVTPTAPIKEVEEVCVILPSIKLNSQRLNKEKQEVKNVVEQSTECKNRSIQSLQNFRVIRKSSTFLKDTSQISLVYAIASILSTNVHEYSPSMGYEYPNTTPETKSDEIIKSGVEELIPIPSECSNDESSSKEDVPTKESKVYSNPLFDDDEINSDELESHVEPNFDALIDSSQKIDYLKEFSGELAHINPEITESDFDFEKEILLIENLLYDNSSPRPLEELNAEIANTIIESLPSLPIPVQDGDSQREEIDIVTETDDVLPLSVENDDDSEGEINPVEELRVDNSISNFKNELSDNEASYFDNPSFPRPPLEPLDADFELNSREEISVVRNIFDKFECLDPRDEFDDDDYSSFIYVKVFSFLSAKSEDTIFDPGLGFSLDGQE
nr:reverse transcriptase domain-containing protein [Tanacetum cinerariifolium]